MTIKEIEEAMQHLEDKINNEHIINERDFNYLDNLQQLYISKISKQARKEISKQARKEMNDKSNRR
jgi:hypothetical protein